MSDEFPKPSGDCITDRKRQRAAEAKAASSFAAPPGSANFTLTAQEIRHLAQFCGMVIQEPTASEAEDERETEIIIASWPEKGVKGDDGMLPPHRHIAYLAEYSEEGCVPLGSPNKMMSFTDQKPFKVTIADLKRPWSGGKNGEHFRCYLCGHRFQVGDTARWQYTNDMPGAGGNPLVCERCDGTKEQIVEKWKQMNAEADGRMWWFFTPRK